MRSPGCSIDLVSFLFVSYEHSSDDLPFVSGILVEQALVRSCLETRLALLIPSSPTRGHTSTQADQAEIAGSCI